MIAKKRYTKKQILEAIQHWSRVLASVNESKSKFLDACSKEFGEAVVFDDKDFEELNREDANEIRLLMEGDDMSAFEPIQFDDGFKRKYKDIFSFNGPSSACMIFGQRHHKH